MKTSSQPLFRSAAAVALSALVLAACSGGKEQQGGAPGAGAPPQAPAVTVMTVASGSVPMVTELPGRTTPYLIAELRPQVTGILTQRAFDEGSEVKAGQVLYRIDDAPYQAAHDSAKAALARAEANAQVARIKAERHAGLVKIDAVSKQANDDTQAALKQAQAEVAAAKAALDKARIDLDYTRLKSPISGRIGRSAVTPGALVTANQVQALATVQQLDPIYVDLTQSSADMLRMRAEIAAGRLQAGAKGEVPVKLILEDGSEYAVEGRLALSEVTVDEGTGSVTLRARFPNADGVLLPGMYVRARLPQGTRSEAILVPHKALSRDPLGNALVMVVNAESKVEARPVKVAQSLASDWVVTGGLAAGERIIVEGLQKARPGAPVQAQEAGATPAAATPAAKAS
ncbi:efflux RND transporter periplasmic adaptor subunit [Thauera sp.]|uniref:efflux RND transporter periplasmic adaptor subunit n=1 Tax=Thauera TaxID=33057 RepID=UPI001B7877B9|nr:efflux RND transporter periplasmic adaptor subunit [Thauera sp.]MBP6130036.1 efflux RND transporter periplasmic adaptor subunit [Thauera sp.]MBP7047250.1 efflux RND transporter periplasmic adaptor subunit [Thauera sp.]HNB07097.1 efflux RND transporter periplasmic adaptor subunit [Thauera aminoaromatica]HNG80901.1 efflux RND transporter periplasmic adaptor subunit [Burkholderiaceae bacterium]